MRPSTSQLINDICDELERMPEGYGLPVWPPREESAETPKKAARQPVSAPGHPLVKHHVRRAQSGTFAP
ncbi:hypothetical protein [Nocardia brasiliensis]|uniref:hypothetical protein n=1 Tax=Nocardia brasiliensis TaxID=37326 RepID=UPI000A906AAE|nr:hypothetical protein [Nocardia brasiliensis]MBF6124861.1 hypothetical protein [Nocardia brasiliensis]MBF6548365.1 hypothetical protein [Nocardia brasiliensis]